MSAGNELSKLEIVPTGADVGAEIKGVDFSKPVADDLKAALIQAWHDHLVLLFRDQDLSDEDVLAFGNLFGGARGSTSRQFYLKAGFKPGGHRISKVPGITYISNLDDDGNPTERNAGLGSLEVDWHTDNSYSEIPPAGTALYSRVIQHDGGGNTSFNNQYVAYDTLPKDLKEACWGKYQKHDVSRNSAGVLRPTLKLPESPEDVDGPVHPLLRVHPGTGKTVMYLGRRRSGFSNHLVGMPYEESQALLKELWAHATQEDLKWTHKWQVGELILWDNRSAMHYRTASDPTRPRILHRTMIEGQALVAPWDEAAAA
ncbi:MAG: TauD/TfdA family dioxygenase [Proteobacteria bacterium]|nr:TauD/TfdA family dioxygenase [Pseudomonadota bacterium]